MSIAAGGRKQAQYTHWQSYRPGTHRNGARGQLAETHRQARRVCFGGIHDATASNIDTTLLPFHMTNRPKPINLTKRHTVQADEHEHTNRWRQSK